MEKLTVEKFSLEDAIGDQIAKAKDRRQETLEELLTAGDTWVVGEG